MTAIALGPLTPQTLQSTRVPVTSIETVANFRFQVTPADPESNSRCVQPHVRRQFEGESRLSRHGAFGRHRCPARCPRSGGHQPPITSRPCSTRRPAGARTANRGPDHLGQSGNPHFPRHRQWLRRSRGRGLHPRQPAESAGRRVSPPFMRTSRRRERPTRWSS